MPGSNQRIRILDGIAGAASATGLALIIDVFRAFTVTPWLFYRGAARVIPVASEAEARAEKERCSEVLLAGERDGRRLPGFDLGNSPAEVAQSDLSGKTVIQRTSAGTQGLMGATGAEQVLTASFVNAGSVARYVAQSSARDVCLVAMGWNGIEATIEDRLCAEYLRDLLCGRQPEYDGIRARICADPSGAKFADPDQPCFPAEDLDYCLDLDRFDFVVELDRETGVRPQLVCRHSAYET